MTEYEQNGWVLIKNFIEPQGINTISRYIEYSYNQNLMERIDAADVKSYANYGDPLTETILYNSLADMEVITGKKLYPTYSFSRIYVKGDVLKPHLDRPSCEVSASIHVATKGESWPIWMKVKGKEPVRLILNPGDAVIYKGCDVTHWREVADKTEINVQFMLHYVDQNGPNAEYKYDKRPSLGTPGTPQNIRSI